jgi:hypothetical protein
MMGWNAIPQSGEIQKRSKAIPLHRSVTIPRYRPLIMGLEQIFVAFAIAGGGLTVALMITLVWVG